MQIKSFPPVVGDAPKVLILGSMPSVKSLEKKQYYGNERNHFWALMAEVLKCELPLAYQDKLGMLRSNHIAIWDVVAICARKGSLDKDIKDEAPNPIIAFLAKYESIKLICFNGTSVKKIYEKYHPYLKQYDYLLLPSSSPIPTKKAKAAKDKLEAWLQMRAYS